MAKSRWTWAVLIAAGFLFLPALAVLLLHTPAAKRYALGKLREYLAREGIDLEVRRIDYNILRGTVRFEETSLR
ncbi:MAG: hypothetical protein DMG07_14540, partial [Acidobacteria bacterium]